MISVHGPYVTKLATVVTSLIQFSSEAKKVALWAAASTDPCFHLRLPFASPGSNPNAFSIYIDEIENEFVIGMRKELK